MRSSKQALLLFLLLVTACTFSKAQLYFKNASNSPVWIAIGYYGNSGSWCGFYSEGWWKVVPGEKACIIGGSLKNRYYYYYAHDSGSGLWCGSSYFTVTKSYAFKIKNGDYQYTNDRSSRKRVGMKRIDTGSATEFIMRLTK